MAKSKDVGVRHVGFKLGPINFFDLSLSQSQSSHLYREEDTGNNNK